MTHDSDPAMAEAEPLVVDAVTTVRDRFGATGLRSMVDLATRELARVEQAEAKLAVLDDSGPAAAPSRDSVDAADTQAWLAYTEAEPEQ